MILWVCYFYLTCILLSNSSQGSFVITIDDSNFKEKVLDDPEGVWLLDFYAPWCGHCKKLAPELDGAAVELLHDPKIHIGKVDSTISRNLSMTYDVKGYPTLLYFKDGLNGKYEGPRTKAGFVSFMQKLSTSAFTVFSSTDELHRALASVGHAFVLSLPILNSTTDDNRNSTLTSIIDAWQYVFVNIAREYHMHAHFFIFYTERAATHPTFSKMETNVPSVELVNDVSNGKDSSEEQSMTAPKEYIFRQFVEQYNRRLVSHIDSHNFKSLASLGRTLLLLVYDYTSADSSVQIQSFQTACTKFGEHDSALYGYIDGRRWKGFFRQYNVTRWPSLLLLNVPAEQYFSQAVRLNYETASDNQYVSEFTMQTNQFLQQFFAGQITMSTYSPPNLLEKVWRKLVDHYPYSAFLAASPVVFLVLTWLTPHPDRRRERGLTAKGKRD